MKALIPIIIGVLFLIILISIYIIVYLKNKNTKIPKGCEIAFLEAQTCGTCYVNSCSMRDELNKEGEE